MNPKRLEPFKMAYQKRLEQADYNAWLQGNYIRDAIGSCLLDKKYKYPKQPYSMNKTEGDGLSEEEQFLLWIDAYNRKYDGEN